MSCLATGSGQWRVNSTDEKEERTMKLLALVIVVCTVAFGFMLGSIAKEAVGARAAQIESAMNQLK